MPPTPEELAALQQQEEQQQIQTPTNDSGTDIQALIRETVGAADNRARQAEQRARELEDQLLRMQQNNAPAPAQNNQIDNASFWNQPADNLRAMINEQIKPVLDVAASLQRERLYASVKQQYKNSYPGFANIEDLVDKYMEGKEISHQQMQQAITSAVGEFVLSGRAAQLNAHAPAPNTPTPQAPVAETPPAQAHLRPSQSQLEQQRREANKPKVRQLNELEKRLAKEAGLTDEQYLTLLASETQVSNWKK